MNSMTILFIAGFCVMFIEMFVVVRKQLQEPNRNHREKLTQLEKESQELN